MGVFDKLHDMFAGPVSIGWIDTIDSLDACLARLPRQTIAGAQEGARGLFVGKAVSCGAELPLSPMSAKPCVLGLLKIARADAEEVSHALSVRTDFWLDDGTGRALVRANQVETLLHLTSMREAQTPQTDLRSLRKLYGGALHAARWVSHTAIDTHGHHVNEWVHQAVVTHTEQAVLPGDEIWVVAKLGSEIAQEGTAESYREQARIAVLLPADDAISIYLTDPPAPRL